MKVKRFNNLWAMGLILFGAILVAFYLTKLLFPKFIVGVAEIPRIVEIGNFIDSHKWLYCIVNGFISFFTMYLFSCACCKIKLLSLLECLILAFIIAISFPIGDYLPSVSFAYNNIVYLLMPLIIILLRKEKHKNIFIPSAVCYIITSIAQSMSLVIRDISTLISYPNTATFFILIIDGTIWNVLLYLYFNYKGEKENG